MHPKATTLKDLQARVDMYAEDCFDSYSSLKGLKFSEPFNVTFQSGQNDLFGQETHVTGKMNDWAFNQVAERLDSPSIRWLADPRHCPDTLRVEIMNRLTDIRPDAKLFVRSKGEVVRAVLSSEYTKFDNKTLVDMLGEAISTMGVEPEVHRMEIGDEFRGYILLPQVTFAEDPTKPIVPPGSQDELPGITSRSEARPDSPRLNNGSGNGGLHPAIYISNSERGGGKARICGAVYRYVCSNGIIWGWNSQDIFAIRHRWISEGAMAILVAEAVGTALKMSEEAALKFMASQERHLEPRNLKGILAGWASNYGLSVDATDNWLAVVSSEATSYGRADDPRVFDVVNAATFVAQTRQPEERELMERMAGDLLRQ